MKENYKIIKGNERRSNQKTATLGNMLINLRSWGIRYKDYPRLKALMMSIKMGQKSWSGDVLIEVYNSFHKYHTQAPDHRCGRGHSYKFNNPDTDLPF